MGDYSVGACGLASSATRHESSSDRGARGGKSAVPILSVDALDFISLNHTDQCFRLVELLLSAIPGSVIQLLLAGVLMSPNDFSSTVHHLPRLITKGEKSDDSSTVGDCSSVCTPRVTILVIHSLSSLFLTMSMMCFMANGRNFSSSSNF